jgi:hypothetical protein
MGVKAPEVEVRFENLTVVAETLVGGQPLPTLINATLNGIQVRQLARFNVLLLLITLDALIA